MKNEKPQPKEKPTLGSLFAGIGGFDLGFERAGFRTSWQVEINPRNRAVLGHRFPHSRQFEDVRACGAANLEKVDCITAGFPCQDISHAGNTRKGPHGLKGEKSGLFHEAMRIVGELQPRWVVFENVPALLSCNAGKDFAQVIRSFAECGYVGFFRVLDAQYFGSPARRRRLFVVGGLGVPPPLELLFDSRAVVRLPSSLTPECFSDADSWPGYTLLAPNQRGRISIGSELLCAVENGWGAMVERKRISACSGVSLGLDDHTLELRFASGNAVHPNCGLKYNTRIPFIFLKRHLWPKPEMWVAPPSAWHFAKQNLRVWRHSTG